MGHSGIKTGLNERKFTALVFISKNPAKADYTSLGDFGCEVR